MKRPKCVFCGFSGELTNEHIYSRWIHRYLKKTHGTRYELVATSFPDRTDFKKVKRVGSIYDLKIKCVCGSRCNNGWMRNHIENPAIPAMTKLINGESFRLMPNDQQKVAAWAALKSIILEYDMSDRSTSHHMQRKFLMNRHVPPERGWGIWIGYWDRRNSDSKLHVSSYPFLVLPDRIASNKQDHRATYYNSVAVTQVVGQLFIHVVHSPHPNLVIKWRFDLPDGGTLRRIWPPSDVSILWPPRVMSERDAEIASRAIHSFMARS